MGRFYIPSRRTVYLALGAINSIVPVKTKIFILCYHGIGNDTWAFSVSKKTFEMQMNFLEKQGYDFITLSTLNNFIDGKEKITRPSVVITFDDGYKDVLKIKEFIAKKKIKPTMFLLSNITQANRKELANEREFLSNEEVRSLIADGWEIGSHTATHSDMHALTDKQIVEEVIGSKKTLEKHLGIKIRYIAYPKGRYSKKILAAVKKTGYTLGLTMDDGRITPGMQKALIPRIGVDRTHSYSEFKVLFAPLVIVARGFLKGVGYGK